MFTIFGKGRPSSVLTNRVKRNIAAAVEQSTRLTTPIWVSTRGVCTTREAERSSWRSRSYVRPVDGLETEMQIAALERAAILHVDYGVRTRHGFTPFRIKLETRSWRNPGNREKYLGEAQSMLATAASIEADYAKAQEMRAQAARLRKRVSAANEDAARALDRSAAELMSRPIPPSFGSSGTVRERFARALTNALTAAIAADQGEYRLGIALMGRLLYSSEKMEKRDAGPAHSEPAVAKIERRVVAFNGKPLLILLRYEPRFRKTGEQREVTWDVRYGRYSRQLADVTANDGFMPPVADWVSTSFAQFTTDELAAAKLAETAGSVE